MLTITILQVPSHHPFLHTPHDLHILPIAEGRSHTFNVHAMLAHHNCLHKPQIHSITTHICNVQTCIQTLYRAHVCMYILPRYIPKSPWQLNTYMNQHSHQTICKQVFHVYFRHICTYPMYTCTLYPIIHAFILYMHS